MTIDALARALMLTAAERAHLRNLARSGAHRGFAREKVPPALERILHDLPVPAYLTGQRWDLLSWNAAAADLFGDFGTLPEKSRNILFYMLTDPRAKQLFRETWQREAQRMVAQFRLDFGLWAGDPAFEQLLATLRARCPGFQALWDGHEVRGQKIGTKRLQHPREGIVSVEYATLQANDDRRIKLVLYRFQS